MRLKTQYGELVVSPADIVAVGIGPATDPSGLAIIPQNYIQLRNSQTVITITRESAVLAAAEYEKWLLQCRSSGEHAEAVGPAQPIGEANEVRLLVQNGGSYGRWHITRCEGKGAGREHAIIHSIGTIMDSFCRADQMLYALAVLVDRTFHCHMDEEAEPHTKLERLQHAFIDAANRLEAEVRALGEALDAKINKGDQP